jgi:predicted PurR-regulated permease PerM
VADSGPSTSAVVRVIALVVGAALLLYGAFLVRQVLILVVIAMFLAIGLDPIVRGLARIRLSRRRAVLAVLLGVIAIIGGFLGSVTPVLIRETQNLAGAVPQYARDLSTRNEQFRELDLKYDISTKLREGLNNLPQIVQGSVGGALGVARSIGRALFSILTVGILTIYFLLDLPTLLAGARKLVPRSNRVRYDVYVGHVLERISGYILGQLTVSFIAGVVGTIVLTLFRIPYSLPLGMWIGIAALIPMVGATVGAIPAIIVAFFASVPRGIATLVFFAVYQQVENYVVAPRVMRRAVDISAAAVILAALIGATLLGFVGALLAIPVAATIKVLAHEFWIPRQDAA